MRKASPSLTRIVSRLSVFGVEVSHERMRASPSLRWMMVYWALSDQKTSPFEGAKDGEMKRERVRHGEFVCVHLRLRT